jgi:type IV secretion system protein VirB9
VKAILTPLFAAAAFTSWAMPAQSALIPRPGIGDPRIHVVPYDPTQVIELDAVLGYELLIEFGPDEHIENVAIGDSIGWQVTPNRRANLLFIKPMDKVPSTNMTVITDSRRYSFELTARPRTTVRNGKSIIYSLQFDYPSSPAKIGEKTAEPAAPPLPQVVNQSYSYEGSNKTLPLRIFDDGRSTYFQFRDGEAYPAIFAVEGENNSESVVNSSTRGGYVVVDRLARGFVLRQGGEVTRIYNDGFREALPGPQSPKSRAPAANSWFHL